MTLAPPRFAAALLSAMLVVLAAAIVLPRSLGVLPAALGLIAFFLSPRDAADGRLSAALRTALIPVAAILGLAALSALWAIDSGAALERSVKLAGVMIGAALLFSAAAVLPPRDLARWWWALPAVIAAAASFLIAEYHFDFPLWRLIRGVPADVLVPLAEMNRASVVLTLAALPALALLFSGIKHRRGRVSAALFSTALTLLVVLVQVMTDSQSAQLSFIVGLAVLLIAPAGRRWLWIGAAVLAAAGMIAAPFLAQYLFSLTPQDGGAFDQHKNLLTRTNYMARLELWDFVSRYALQRPLTGYGIEATRQITDFDTRQLYQPGTTLLHPHNAALQIWIEFGAIGALLASAALALLLRSLSKLPGIAAKRAALAMLAAILTVGMVSYGLWQSWWIGLLGYLAALTIITVRILGAPYPNIRSVATRS